LPGYSERPSYNNYGGFKLSSLTLKGSAYIAERKSASRDWVFLPSVVASSHRSDSVMSTSTDASNGIKAMVTDENGEISCSVDETNRIRALLGLRPLNNEKGSNEREAVQNFHASREKERRFAVLSILLLYSLPYQIDIFVGRRRLRSLGRSWRRLERKEFLVRK
jgi:hypothetical protein